MSATLLAIAIDAIVKPSIVLLLTLGIAAVFRRQSASLRHLTWAVGLGSALLVPLLGRTLPEWEPKVARSVMSSIARIQQTEAPAAQLTPVLPEPDGPVIVVPGRLPGASPRRTISLELIAFGIWVSGLLVSVAILLAEFIKLARVSSRCGPVHEHAWLDLSREVASVLRLKRTVRLMRSSSASVLGAWGPIRPRVILPRESEDWPEERMRAVLGHEFAHVKRNDWLVQMIAEVAKGIFWFNPLFWIACSRLRRESEHACDDAVLRLGIDGPSYATHMLDLVRMLKNAGQPRNVMVMASASNLEIRLTAVLNPSLNRSVVAKAAVVTVILLALGLTLPLAAMHSLPAGITPIHGAAHQIRSEVAATEALRATDAAGATATSPPPVEVFVLSDETGSSVRVVVSSKDPSPPLSPTADDVQIWSRNHVEIPSLISTPLLTTQRGTWFSFTSRYDLKAGDETRVAQVTLFHDGKDLVCDVTPGNAEGICRVSKTVQAGAQVPLAPFLEKNPELHLVGADDMPTEFREDFKSRRFRGTAAGDTNGDGAEDFVAVLVRGSGDRRRFGVAVFHGAKIGYSKDPVWVVRDSKDLIWGVRPQRRSIWLLVCFGCDYFPEYRWSGEWYERSKQEK